MNSMLDSDDANLSEILCVRDENGRPALRIGLLATMFITEPWTRSVREAVAAAAEEYIRQFREHLRWAMHPKAGHMHAIEKRRVPFPQDWLLKHEDGKSWSFGFHSGEQANAAPDEELLVASQTPTPDQLALLARMIHERRGQAAGRFRARRDLGLPGRTLVQVRAEV